MTFQVLPSPEIWHRDDFPLLCMWRQLTRIVEVGVDHGTYSRKFMERSWNIELYLGVDSYEPHGNDWSRDPDLLTATTNFAPYSQFARIIKQDSVSVAKSLKNFCDYYSKPLDFVYIDAGHSYEQVAADMAAWWPLLSNKGILAGHDFAMQSGDLPGVRRAVEDFAREHALTIYHTYRDDPQSWYIYKNEQPQTISLFRRP